ncbi:MAG: hypothetical protein LiPW15_41 [Parcubacteria group bacterium LiPW_15]|nr:MAG: hypothetical protein LiPW15_41 [Parcubacteria group bacterium LiPW_15]
MRERPQEFLPSNEKKGGFLGERGELSDKEKRLSRILEAKIESQRIPMESSSGNPSENAMADRSRIKGEEIKREREREHNLAVDPEAVFSRDRAKISEMATIYALQNGKWLGKNSTIRPASKIDDYFGGVDIVAELNGAQQLAVGIDTTVSASEIPGKMRRQRDLILKKKLPGVKYFKTDRYNGELNNVPLVAIGADRKKNSALAGVTYDLENIDEYNAPAEIDAASQKLEQHIMQFVILYEILLQLRAYLKLAEQTGGSSIIQPIKSDLQGIEEVIRDKMPKDKALQDAIFAAVRKDEIYNEIKIQVDALFTNYADEEEPIFVAKGIKEPPPPKKHVIRSS